MPDYTENDIYENIQSGNVYFEPNIKCKLSLVDDYIYHATPDNDEWNIDFQTMYVDAELGEPTDGTTEGYSYFKDGSYVRLEIVPTWGTGQLPILTYLAFNTYFGIKDATTGTVTEILMSALTGLVPYKKKWFYVNVDPSPYWDYDDIIYQPHDKFRYYFGWWSVASDKFRYFFVPYESGNGAFLLDDYLGYTNRNQMSSGAQGVINITTTDGQRIAEYLCGDYSEGTEYPDVDSTTGGGNGTFYNRNDEIHATPLPSLQAIDFGFTSLYNPNASDMRAICQWLWSDDFTDNIKKNFASPFENILGFNFIALPEDDNK